jgi:hypothetical protein
MKLIQRFSTTSTSSSTKSSTTASLTFKRALAGIIALSLLGVGCAEGTNQENQTSNAVQPLAKAEEKSSQVQLEQALRLISRGKDWNQAQQLLEKVLATPNLPSNERDEATLAMSQVLKATGKKEQAIKTLEDLLATHSWEGSWSLQSKTESTLFELVTGTPQKTENDDSYENGTIAPIAKVFAPYFKADSTGTFQVKLIQIGGDSKVSDKLGTFNIRDAIHYKQKEACSFCKKRVNVHTHSSGESSWTGISKAKKHMTDALVVYYFDLDQMKIPSRYDAELPMPSQEIEDHLKQGKGVISVKNRENAPPVVLIAAPRRAQWEEVEKQFSEMKSLPNNPVFIELKAHVHPNEIQRAIRKNFSDIRKCYEALLQSSPKAAGKIVLSFGILPSGSMDDLKLETQDSPLNQQSFMSCVENVANKITFPSTKATKTTTVKYPLSFSPDN